MCGSFHLYSSLFFPLCYFTSKQTLSLADRELVCVHVCVMQFKSSSSQSPPAECVKLKNLSELRINSISISFLFRLLCITTPPILLSHNYLVFSSDPSPSLVIISSVLYLLFLSHLVSLLLAFLLCLPSPCWLLFFISTFTQLFFP